MAQEIIPPSSLIPHPSSLIPHPSSLIPHSSLISHLSSLIPHPSSLIHHPSSLIPHPYGGCHGNLQGIARLVQGMKAEEAISKLEGISCGYKATSCGAQLAKALKEALQHH